MLPKVSIHIVHSASRAAASIHQSQSIRNVFQFQTSSGSSVRLTPRNSSGSSSGGKKNGPSRGGTKSHTGSRFHHSTTVRAVTQVASSFLVGDFPTQTDDREDPSTQPAIRLPGRARFRSRSLLVSSQDQVGHAEKSDTITTIQLHARPCHVFAPTHFESASTSSQPPKSELIALPHPIFRRNSTSSAVPSDTIASTESAPAELQTLICRNSYSPDLSDHTVSNKLESIQPHLSTPISYPESYSNPTLNRLAEIPQQLSMRLALNFARDSGNPYTVAEEVRKFLQDSFTYTVTEYNAALEALFVNRCRGEPCDLFIRTYNHMLRHSILPNSTTFLILISALTNRDVEVFQVIDSLESRIKRHTLSARPDVSDDKSSRDRIDKLRKENNFRPAMSMFSTLIAMGSNHLCQASVYQGLLQSCAFRGHVNGAIHVFAQMESRNCKGAKVPIIISPIVYKHLIEVYCKSGNLKGAEEIFSEYQAACRRGSTAQYPDASSYTDHAMVWNQMIKTYLNFQLPDMAVSLVEQMLMSQSDSSDPASNVVPSMTSSTFTAVIAGFCQAGDISTALSWFERLPQLSKNDRGRDSIGYPVHLESSAWSILFETLASRELIEELNRFYLIMKTKSPKFTSTIQRLILFRVNMRHLNVLDVSQFSSTMNFLVENVAYQDRCPPYVISEICSAFIARDMPERAVDLLSQFININFTSEDSKVNQETLRSMQLSLSKQVYDKTLGCVPFVVTISLARLADKLRVKQQEEHIPLFLHSYGLSRSTGSICKMELRDWELLLYASIEVERATTLGRPIHIPVEGYAFEGIVSLLGDISSFGHSLNKMNSELLQLVVKLVEQQRGFDGMQAVFRELGPSFAEVLKPSPTNSSTYHRSSPGCFHDSGGSSPIPLDRQLRITAQQTKAVHARLRSAMLVDGTSSAYVTFCHGIGNGVVPAPAVLGALIQNLGRSNCIQELQHAYAVAQSVWQALGPDESSPAWFTIENSMVIGLAHHGEVEAAHDHRVRILERGGAPTADAYGALIYHVKETTDDTSNAIALFQESQHLGVFPNQYLYNNIISKLAKARKADEALELFHRMRMTNVQPSSVTYGAVIGACARVGDALSAESLFAEMASSAGFKPRVPPYNTMMQLYTTTKPNRERALHYYDELRKVKIQPSGHTYKLLIDAYGTIEPVEIDAMERVVQMLQKDENVPIQGAHFASLINAYGCIQKNIAKAIEVFNSISSYPGSPLPDAIVFEAMINALVANRLTHLMPEWVDKMNTAGVHMTAYIANFLIKGYSMVGDIKNARNIFQSLEDPPVGMASPHHLPHIPRASSVTCNEPAYREPSTWEAMIRAEMGSGNRPEALNLLEKLKTRQYPEAVYSRISGILIDHSTIFHR